MKRVALISHLSEVSGAGVSLVDTARGLQGEGFECTLVLPGAGPIEERAKRAGVPYVIVENPQVSMAGAGVGEKVRMARGRMQYVSALAAWLKREKIEVVVVNTMTTIFAGMAARRARLPIVWWVHELPENPTRATRLKMWYIERVAGAVVYASGLSRKLFRAPRVPIHHFQPNYVDAEALRDLQVPPELDQELGLDPAATIISFNGPFRRKGADVFLRAAIQVCKQSSKPVQFVIVGEGEAAVPEFEEALKQMAHAARIGSQVKWLGLRQDVPVILKRSDMFVSASRNEARPIVINEALACGTPVVATNVGDCAAMLGNGHYGEIVPAEDAGTLAQAMLRNLDRPDAARKKALLAQDKLVQEFSGGDFWSPLKELLVRVRLR